jgi:uncharacterized protein (TIRG00374 family)
MRRILILVLGVIISVGALLFAFQGFDMGDVWEAMSNVRWPFFLLMLVPYVFTFLTKVWRWQTLFYPDQDLVPFRIALPTLMISYVPLPFRLGEVARGVALSARTGIPAARVFSTIFVEKVLDVLTLLLLLGVSLPFVDLPNDASSRGSLALIGVLVIALVAMMLFFVMRPNMARGLISLVSRPLPERFGNRLLDITDNVLKGLAPLAVPSIALRVGLWSLATWLVNIVTIYLEMLAFNIDTSPVVAVVLVVATNLSMAIPAAPGYIGTFEAAVVGVLVALGQPLDSSQAFAIIYHFVGLVPVAIIGVIAAVQQGINFASLNSGDQGRTTKDDGAVVPAPIQNPKAKVENRESP